MAEIGAARLRNHLAAMLGCGLVGALLAVAPHLAALASTGRLDYVGDGDDAAYLAVARAPYYGEPGLRDPFSGRWEGAPSYYPWMLFVPLAKLTRWLGLPLPMVALVWRVVGGFGLGSSLAWMFTRVLHDRSTAWAVGCTLVCLADAGFVEGRPIWRTLSLVRHLLDGSTPMAKPDALPQYRVVSPLLNLPPLVVLVGAVSGRRVIVWLGIAALGLCVLTSFYMWTAAAMALGGLVAAALVDAIRSGGPSKWVRFRSLGIVLAGGLIVGAPQTIHNARTFADPAYRPILERSKVATLAPGDPARGRNLANRWLLAKLAIGAIGIVGRRAWGASPAWGVALSGYLLANSALLTGVDFENSLWVYVYSPMSEVVLLAIVARCLGGDRAARWLWALPVALLTIAAIWRPFEAAHAAESTRNSRILGELQPLLADLARLDDSGSLVGPPEAKLALIYTRSAILYQYQYSWNMSLISDQTVHERHALSGWLRGQDRSTYLDDAARDRNVFYPRPEHEPAEVARRRVAIFDALGRGERPDLIARFRPRWLLARDGDPPPARGGPWRLLRASAAWSLWHRSGAGLGG